MCSKTRCSDEKENKKKGILFATGFTEMNGIYFFCQILSQLNNKVRFFLLVSKLLLFKS